MPLESCETGAGASLCFKSAVELDIDGPDVGEDFYSFAGPSVY